MKQICILGCGWLGFPLAKSLIEKGNSVKGTTTSPEKIQVLRKTGINPFKIKIMESAIEGEISLFLENADILIIDIPPKLRGNSKENFEEKIKFLIPYIEEAQVQKLIFVSSISVYADDNSTITENTKPFPLTESGKQLVLTENILNENKNFKTTVIRFGGLIGEDRHPIRFLAGRKELENPYAPINLIHLKDCIGIIEAIINNDLFGETFNAVAPYHPLRVDYYTNKAVELQLPVPEFNSRNVTVGKTILSIKVEKILGYIFQNTSL
jgi:nucleoside-diphosphate-sugar epimerase